MKPFVLHGESILGRMNMVCLQSLVRATRSLNELRAMHTAISRKVAPVIHDA